MIAGMQREGGSPLARHVHKRSVTSGILVEYGETLQDFVQSVLYIMVTIQDVKI